MQRIGVFVCWCGSNIAATVDVERVSQALAKEPGVVFSTNYQYMCSQTGQQMIQEKIHEYGLTRSHLFVLSQNARADVPQDL